MAWRLKHSIPKRWHAPGTPPTEPSVLADTVMPISEKAARQQLGFYLQRWLEERPGDRHVTQRDGLNAWCVERPSGCTCTWCERHRAASPEEADNLGWWRMGAAGGHTSSYVRLKRADAPVTRAATERYRVVDRYIANDGRLEPEHTLHSRHFTKADAHKGLLAAVARWRASMRHRTASRYSSEAYNLKIDAHPTYRLLIERIRP